MRVKSTGRNKNIVVCFSDIDDLNPKSCSKLHSNDRLNRQNSLPCKAPTSDVKILSVQCFELPDNLALPKVIRTKNSLISSKINGSVKKKKIESSFYCNNKRMQEVSFLEDEERKTNNSSEDNGTICSESQAVSSSLRENNEVDIQRNGIRKMIPAESNQKSSRTQTPNKPFMNVKNHLPKDFNDPKSPLKNSISDFENGKILLN